MRNTSFLSTKKNFLLFVFLELISIVLIINAHQYAQTKVHNFQTEVIGNVHDRLNFINRHWTLAHINDSLQKQNAQLLQKLNQPEKKPYSPALKGQFDFVPGYIISNQYQFDNNTLIINRGENDNVKPGMGVIAVNGIIGTVQRTSKHYAKVISVLNHKSKTSVSVKNTNYSGFLQWNGQNPNIFEVIDVPENAGVKIGDTLVTAGMSNIFPKDIPIGTIIGFKVLQGRKSYKISLKPFIDMTNLGPVYIIKNKYQKEFDSLTKPKQ